MDRRRKCADEATVVDYYGGGNSGKDVKNINPYSWGATSATEEQEDFPLHH